MAIFCFVRRVGLPVELYNDVAISFVERYIERTGKLAAESYALEAYDSIMIIAQAIEEAGSTDPDAIIAALENITYEGALGTITFPYGNSARSRRKQRAWKTSGGISSRIRPSPWCNIRNPVRIPPSRRRLPRNLSDR